MGYQEYKLKLTDELSRLYFDARVQYLMDKRLSSFYETISGAREKYYLREVEEFRDEHNINEWIIVGDDDYAKYNCMIMKDLGYQILKVTNEDFSHGITDADVISIAELSNQELKKNIGVIINQRDSELLSQEFYTKNNVLVMYSHVVGRNGVQYFDFFEPKSDEVFVDAGALDGETSVRFASWCNGEYADIYAFEPNPNMIDICKSTLINLGNRTSLYEVALWNKKEKVLFSNEGSKWDSRISLNGSILVNADSLDNILKDKRVTYIKLDIEGAELKALKGAEKIIISNKPRMAISVYHNEKDLFEIMDYLISLNLNYQYAIRHYHSDFIETILYVF